MAGFIQNILWNSVSGFVEAGTRTVGGYAGDALIKAGDMVEKGGSSVGTGIERKFSNYGSAISGQAPQKPSAKALPPTARKPVVKRSNSTPASNKPTTGGVKYPGAGTKPSTGAAKKPLPSTASATGAAKKSLPSSATATGAAKGTVGRAKSVAGGAAKSLPKPYSPGGNLSFPEAKKTAVKPGQNKPYTPPAGKTGGGGEDNKPYPGPTTLPGEGKRVPVQAQKYKPAPRMAAPVKEGKMTHISV